MSQNMLQNSRNGRWLIAGLLAAALLAGAFSRQHAAWGVDFLTPPFVVAVAEIDETGQTDEKEFPGGAALKTDPELDRILKRADEFAAEGRFDLACVLWQRVLDESAETVMTRDDWTYKTFKRVYRRYKSVTGEIERTLAKLPAEGLRIYRLTADGEAQAILAAGTGDRLEDALTQVTRRYFLSSHGDDAAFRLACLRMDRYDFVGASRLLSKIREDYPDPSVSQEQILLRLAVASARVGDRSSSQKTLAELKKLGNARVVALVENEIGREGVDAVAAADASEQWPMTLGNPARTGHMKALPLSGTGKTLSELWTEDYDLQLASTGTGPYGSAVHEELLLRRRIARPQPEAGPASRDALVARWKQAGWNPAGEALLYDGLVYYKAFDRLVCRNLETGSVVWMGRRNRYQPDQMSLMFSQIGRRGGAMQTPTELLLFADRVHQGMAIADGVIYNIEGELFDGASGGSTTAQQQIYGYNATPRRTRKNWISAYDAVTGKLKWYRNAQGDEENSKFEVGFLGAPVPFARFLIAPVSDNGALWLYGLDKKSGSVVWKTFLCEEPNSGANPWSPIAISVDGGDAYVSTGSGVVFAVEALSGTVRWAVRYQRTGVDSNQAAQMRYGAVQMSRVNGWNEDAVVPHGKHLVVMASDSDEIFALDRRTGEFLWDSPRIPTSDDPPGEYCLGILGDGLFVGGKNVVRRYDVPSGRLIWQARLDSSLGRGALTSSGVYVPENDIIVQLDLTGGKRKSEVTVATASQEPVGNIYTDGQRLVALGVGRVYALTDIRFRMEYLAKRIAAGHVASQLERMRLRLREGDRGGALEDLRGAYDGLVQQQQEAKAIETLLSGVNELALTSRDPQTALQLISSLPNDFAKVGESANLLMRRRSQAVEQSLQGIVANQTKGAAREVFRAVPLCTEKHLLTAAQRAMAATVSREDSELLNKALATDQLNVRLVALAGLRPALEADAMPILKKLTGDAADPIRLEAAWALGDAGEREALTTFASLLESDDLYVRLRSSQALRGLTGQNFKFSAYETRENRQTSVQVWRDWIAGEGQTAALKFPIQASATLLGRTLICYYSQNKVVELNNEGQEIWSMEVPYAWGCQGLPSGNRIVASYSGRYVAEYDPKGKEIWKKGSLPGAPFSVQRLDTGNTLVTCSDSQRVIELDAAGEIVWNIKIDGRPMDAERIDSGNTLVALQTSGRVVEVNPAGDVVWEINDQTGVLSASRLENGNTLICRSGSNSVVELSREKEIVWQKDNLRHPYDAQRLPSGNTLIVDFEGVHEFDPKGELVWERKENGASRVCRY